MATASRSTDLFADLQEMGAGEFAHLNGTLAAHLQGTEALLRAWGASETVCTAGLYHAVYGTDGFGTALITLEQRSRISGLLGPEAEELVYLYGACDRAAFYPRIGTALQLKFADRFRQVEYDLSHEQLCALSELILANELEIAIGSESFRSAYGAQLAALFARMRGLVSEAGFRHFQEVLG